ncbi:MAG: hypothetical protein WEE51_11720, partial [Pirellulaceae bacterium]
MPTPSNVGMFWRARFQTVTRLTTSETAALNLRSTDSLCTFHSPVQAASGTLLLRQYGLLESEPASKLLERGRIIS